MKIANSAAGFGVRRELLTYSRPCSYVGGMATKPRVEFDGVFYHVIIRRNQR
jgi:hypothetical protein